MNILESLRSALWALTSNRLRTFLTMLGIIIGVGAVITMVAIGEGSRRRIQERLQGLGTNQLLVRPGSQNVGRTVLAAGSSQTLTEEDAETILKTSEHVSAVSPELSRNAQVKYESKNTNTTITGTRIEFLKVRNFVLAEGRYFSAEEIKGNVKVAVLGQTVEETLFGSAQSVGSIIKINGQNFTVIGVLAGKGQTGMGQNQDDQIMVPLTTAQTRLFGLDFVTTIAVQVYDENMLDETTFDIERALRKTHKLRGDAENDFSIRNQADILATAQETSDTMAILLASIAAISLIVGGIGIMNIMVVSVTERTKEIGIRKAIGAKRKDILLQFLIEAMVICLFGGLIGVGIGIGSAYVLQWNAGWRTVVTPDSVLLSFGLSVLVGIFFGFYPALKASQANVIDALRYE
ncbi:MAG TPA: ABC transporter permease [bacterium]|nr:ABC transporter permease [bacterium]HMW35523.1 ABC transporter permease [bacterium]HMY35521.1 ABC transporter permease [bacterium]HMZ04879.1 ABC transporter permease [bacterium]HNB08373.1 ABC transporter permease [bacterium]